MFYHWITLSSMIILMLFIRRNLRLDTTDAPKWANYLDHLEFDEDGKLFTRLYDKRDDFDFLMVNFPYKVVIFQNPLHMVFLFDTLCSGLKMKIFCAEDLFWFQSYWSRDILHENLRLLFGSSMVIQTLFTNLTPLCHLCWMVCSLTVTYNWFPVYVNRDGCHMWGRKCSLFPEHLISLPLGSSWFHPFVIIYKLYII